MMRNPWKMTSFALAAVLAGKLLVPAADADVQPKMREALGSLQAAQSSLEAAAHDKGGHRAKALALTKQAIQQVEAGMRFDNRH